ncbi:hypothetical protein P8452_29581 [Trifolium repens]|nr:hypothetical protein P8452_29581 [Trifolium repens]
MLSREVSLPIRSLSLRLENCNGIDINDINRFVNTTLKRGGIQTLELIMDFSSWNKNHLSNKLSPNVFNCKTLTVLKLKNLCLIIDLPHQVHIPLLKILHMHGVMFKDYYKEIIKLLLGCPILEELELQTYTRLTPPVNLVSILPCISPNVFNYKTLTVLKLKYLRLIDLRPHQVHIPLLKILHMHVVMFQDYQQINKFLLGCPILEELELQTYTLLTPPRVNLPSGGSIRYMPNLVRAAIFNNVYIPFFLFSGARILRTKLMLHMDVRVPTFHNLIQMELFFCSLKGKTWDKKWMWMLEMLQHSPNLQHLTLHQKIEDGIDENNWQDPQTIPKCLSSQLRTCLLRGWRGRKCELQFAEYVMKNSKVLLTMTIHSACSIDIYSKFKMLQKLSVCPRGCELIFD